MIDTQAAEQLATTNLRNGHKCVAAWVRIRHGLMNKIGMPGPKCTDHWRLSARDVVHPSNIKKS